MINLHVRITYIKLLKVNIGENLCDPGLSKAIDNFKNDELDLLKI